MQKYKTINIPLELHKKLKIEALQKGISLLALIEERLRTSAPIEFKYQNETVGSPENKGEKSSDAKHLDKNKNILFE